MSTECKYDSIIEYQESGDSINGSFDQLQAALTTMDTQIKVVEQARRTGNTKLAESILSTHQAKEHKDRSGYEGSLSAVLDRMRVQRSILDEAFSSQEFEELYE